MKFIPTLLLTLLVSFGSYAQEADDEKEKTGGFKKENLFTGGSVNASFFNGATVLGVSPYFGYSINKWLDVAVSANLNYISQRDNVVYGDKLRQTLYGPGAFIRVFPVDFIFLQGHYEYNIIKYKYIPASNSGYAEEKLKLNAGSMLVGGGYSSGRGEEKQVYYYMSLMFDVSKDKNSPYVDGLGRTVPLVRAGIQVPLFQGKR
ncbi:MAG: hypothetical protein WAT19_13275 [Ferruginibacter sp.]